VAAYPATTRILHWVTVLALAAQLAVGYLMDDDGGGRGRGRGRGRGGDSGRGRGRGGDDDDAAGVLGAGDDGDGDGLMAVHVTLGLAILALAVARLLWRRHAGLPPWAATLSPAERIVAAWTEKALLALLFVVPLTGLWLVLVSDDATGVHVAAHIALYVAVAAHVGLVLKHQLIDRDRLLRRML